MYFVPICRVSCQVALDEGPAFTELLLSWGSVMTTSTCDSGGQHHARALRSQRECCSWRDKGSFGVPEAGDQALADWKLGSREVGRHTTGAGQVNLELGRGEWSHTTSWLWGGTQRPSSEMVLKEPVLDTWMISTEIMPLPAMWCLVNSLLRVVSAMLARSLASSSSHTVFL